MNKHTRRQSKALLSSEQGAPIPNSVFPSKVGMTPCASNEPHVALPQGIAVQWKAAAKRKGFDITGRIQDRFHVALRCHVCGDLHASRIYTLMSATPQCPACVINRLQKDAAKAGLVHVERDPDDRHYSSYRAPCGHELRRQHEIVRRAAAGSTGLRCEICHAASEAAKAQLRGWKLMGPDPEGNPNYRLYEHGGECGATQRIARANMQTGRFGCETCGIGWAAAQSYIYAMRFTLASGRELVKLGFSRDPHSRLVHQLQVDRAMPCEILRSVPVATGRAALIAEKRMHSKIKRSYPGAMVHSQVYRGQIRVGSELYDASLTPIVLSLLDALLARPGAN